MTLNLPNYPLRDTNPDPNKVSSCECRIDATINMTAKWTHEDPNTQNDTNDPPPTSVWVVETSAASWGGVETGVTGEGGGTNAASGPGGGVRPADAVPPVLYTYSGSSNDGIGDPEVKTPVSGPPYTGSNSTSPPPPTPPLPPGWHYCAVAKDLITLPGIPHTLLADGTATGKQPRQVGVMCSLGPYTIKVHATPYNFRRQNFSGQNTSVTIDNGTLIFHYVWSSTSGSLTDLRGETIHENVVCSVQTDNPPFLWQPSPLTDISRAADYANGIDDLNTFGSYAYEPVSQAFGQTYKADSFSLTQSFLFSDPATMQAGVEQPIPGTIGPFQIKEAVIVDPGSPSGFSFVVTKDTIPSDPINLP